MQESEEELLGVVEALNRCLWGEQIRTPLINEWLKHFRGDCDPGQPGRLQALYLLSRFMYFGDEEVRALVRALYRDHFRYPLVAARRRAMGDSLDFDAIAAAYAQDLERSRFLAIGNPSESGALLLYYYRQENRLNRRLFISTHELFDNTQQGLARPEVARYVFIDDFCGSGRQGVRYSRDLLRRVRTAAAQSGVAPQVEYHVLLGTKRGLEHVRTQGDFDNIASVMRLDESFRVFSDESRYFDRAPEGVTKELTRRLAETHGRRLEPTRPLGFDDGQLLVGFDHNTPNNTLPIFWHSGDEETPWQPLFRRYLKVSGVVERGW